MASPVVVDGRFVLFPEIEAYHSDYLEVGDGHRLFYEEAGNPQGRPVVFLHGGPGGNILPNYRRFFDPHHYRIILFDQRGSGQSRPHAELTANTTWNLVADIEKLRAHCGVQAWQVFGGSWGTTLALCYAISHPTRVTAMILRGIFLCRPWEIGWLYQQGASRLFPDAFDLFQAQIPPAERGDMVAAYHPRLTHADENIRLSAAKAWSAWEAAISKLIPDPQLIETFEEDLFALAFARIECHYFIHKGFLATDNWILENLAPIQEIPARIIHGRYDAVCPVENAWELHKQLPQSELFITPDAGHAAMEPGTLHALIDATEAFKRF